MTIGVAFALMAAFFSAGLYVAGALGLLALILMHFYSDAPLWNIMGNRAWEPHTDFTMVAIPLFTLMGELVLRSGFGERMYLALSRWVSFLPGGLIHANVASCAVFSACAGSSVATAATISRIALPSFRERGYNERLVLGSLAAGGTLGILIPPSIMLALYAVTVGESMGRLFLAGFVPGFMLAAVFMIMIGAISLIWKGAAPREKSGGPFEMQGWRARIAGTIPLIPIFALIFAVLGTIYLGLATPTEAAAFGVAGAFVLLVVDKVAPLMLAASVAVLNGAKVSPLLPAGLQARLQAVQQTSPLSTAQVKFVVRTIRLAVWEASFATARTTGMIFLILIAAFTIQFAFARLGISSELAEWVSGLHLSAVQLVIILVLFYLVLGTFMESYAMMMTTLPILLPTLVSAGIDKVWFGIILVILLEAALVSPPEGLNLYVLHGIRRDVDAEVGASLKPGLTQSITPRGNTIFDVWIGVLPFVVCMIVVIGLIIAFPKIALWLPDLVKGAR